MRLNFVIIAFLFCYNVFGNEYSAYEKKLIGYEDRISEYDISLTNLPPIENQKSLGFCYAFSARTILEQYHCKELAMDCTELEDKDKFSVLDIASYNYYSPYYLDEGGRIDKILKSIKRFSFSKKISTEECASYSKLNYSYATGTINGGVTRASTKYKDTKGGWEYLRGQYNKYQKSSFKDQKMIIDSTNESLKLNIDRIQLLEAFSTTDGIKSYFFKLLIPEHCRNGGESRDVLDYKIGKYPLNKDDNPSNLELTKKIYYLLKNNTPFNVSFCAKKVENKKTGELECVYHGAVLKGIKKVCEDKGFCELMVQFHNSYGEKWQKKHSGGWVRLNPLLESLWPDVKFNWIEPTFGNMLDLNYREISWIRSTITRKYQAKNKKRSKEIKPQKRKYVIYKCGNQFSTKKIDESCITKKY